MTKGKKLIGILGLALVLTAPGKEVWAVCEQVSGYACVCNSGETKRVCVKRSSGVPDIPDDVEVDYGCTDCSDAPLVQFKLADSGWELYSEVITGSAAANLGAVLLASDVSPDDGTFTVAIKRATGYAAANVSSIALDSTESDWTGGSNLSGGLISGNVSGAITLVEDSGGSQGQVTGIVVVLGNVTGPVTVSQVNNAFYMNGTVGTVTVESINSGGELRLGAISSNVTVSDEIAGTGNLRLVGSLPSSQTVTVHELKNTASVNIEGSVAGTLELDLSLPSGTFVGTGQVSGTIDLNGGDVTGTLSPSSFTSTGEIVDGGDVYGTAYLAFYPLAFQGTATFDSVKQGGIVYTFGGGDLDGIVNVLNEVAGEVEVQNGEFTSGAVIAVGSVSSTGMIVAQNPPSGVEGEIAVNGTMAGLIDITDGGLSGDIYVGGTTSGTVNVDGGTSGVIYLSAVSGTVNLDDGYSGYMNIDGDLSNQVNIAGGMDGTLELDGDLKGTLSVSGGMTQYADITTTGKISSSGRLTINGQCDGDMSIGTQTDSNSRIHLPNGFGSTGSIVINGSEGNYNAAGEIVVGPLTGNPVSANYDGCIHVQDQSGTGNGGDMSGRIRVAVCDDEAANFNICVDGSVTGTISIVTTGCDNAPGHSCSACTP